MTLATSPVKPPIIENIPEKLTERPQWVLWHYEERDGKLTKVPYTPAGWRASATDLLDWTPCAEALAAYQRGHYDGIGFVFSSADPFVGIDLDKCRNPETGEISEWAQKIISRVQEGYVEVSPSGRGVHVIVEGTVRSGGMRKKVRVNEEVVGEIEMYSRERFFTITGNVL
jgi:putative DNA primase/helicase